MMSKTRSPGYEPGNHWVICDRCGLAKRQSEVTKEWNGLVVCTDTCWEPRHPQDFVRGVADDQSPKGLVRPEPADQFVSVTFKTPDDTQDYTVPSRTTGSADP